MSKKRIMYYPIAYLVAVIGLIWWHHYQDDESKSQFGRFLFLLGFAGYLGTLLLAGMSIGEKLFTGFWGLLVLALVNWFFQFLRPKHRLFWSIVVLIVAVIQVFVVKLPAGLSENTEAIDFEVDEHGEWLVELDRREDLSLFKLRLKGIGVVRQAFFPNDVNATDLNHFYVVDVLDDANAVQAGRIIRESPRVKWAEWNEKVAVWPSQKVSANVGSAADGLGVNDPEVSKQWAMKALDMGAFYEFLRKQHPKARKKAVLAILDTGVDAKHEDLKAGFVSTEGRSDNDPVGHGTHCAGIAGAVTNNGVGIASTRLGDSYYSVTSIKVLNANGMGTQETIIDGILKAADAGVSVISMSLGGRADKRKQRAYEKAIQYANKKGAIVVVAAGNENRNAKTVTPANVNGVITVSAIDSSLTRALFSNSVKDLKMGLAAPGVGIYSTIPGHQYASFNGTSMATPFVAGLVAMMKSIRPKLTTEEAYKILAESGKSTRNPETTGVLIQPAKAMEGLLR